MTFFLFNPVLQSVYGGGGGGAGGSIWIETSTSFLLGAGSIQVRRIPPYVFKINL